MKQNLIVLLIAGFALGCGIHSDAGKTDGATSPEPALVTQTQDQTESPAAGVIDQKETDQKPLLMPGLTAEQEAKIRLLSDLNEHQILLKHKPIMDILEIHVISPEDFGVKENPIVINRVDASDYFVRLQLPPAEVKLMIDRFSQGEHWRREYVLKPIQNGASENTVVYQSDADKDEVVREYGEDAADEFSFDASGNFKLRTIYNKKPLFKTRVNSAPAYRISFKNGLWEATFEDTRLRMLKQVRTEAYTGERKDVESAYRVKFDDIASDLFSGILQSKAVRDMLTQQGISEIRAQDVWAIKSRIRIEGSLQVSEPAQRTDNF